MLGGNIERLEDDPATCSQKPKEYRAETAAALENRTGGSYGLTGDFREVFDTACVAIVGPRQT